MIKGKGGGGSLIDDLVTYDAIVDLSVGTEITLNIPANVVMLSRKLIVKTAITGSGGLTDWSAAFSGGSTVVIATAQALAKNTHTEKPDVGIETTALTQIEISPNDSETFATGEIKAEILVRETPPLPDYP